MYVYIYIYIYNNNNNYNYYSVNYYNAKPRPRGARPLRRELAEKGGPKRGNLLITPNLPTNINPTNIA